MKEVEPRPIQGFLRTHIDGEFAESGRVLAAEGSSQPLRFEVLWPEARPRSYEDAWDRTTNGNSVTFRLEYEDFSMLFTGDLHQDAQEILLATLSEEQAKAKLACDVLKLPHHGSDDTQRDFLKVAAPVVSVATMGSKGFRSKTVSKSAYQHPSSEIISALGGAHRVYHTYIHEKRFNWERVDTKQKLDALREKMLEETHILIETDGRWFRVVETADPSERPTVAQTRRGNGTRWIEAR